ncbi:hypothetical protein FOZ62_022027, partial [Perkinsus olseni]
IGGENIEGLTSIQDTNTEAISSKKVIDSKEGWEVGFSVTRSSQVAERAEFSRLLFVSWEEHSCFDALPADQLMEGSNFYCVSGDKEVTAENFESFVTEYYEDVIELSSHLIALTEVGEIKLPQATQWGELLSESIRFGAHRDYGLLTIHFKTVLAGCKYDRYQGYGFISPESLLPGGQGLQDVFVYRNDVEWPASTTGVSRTLEA